MDAHCTSLPAPSKAHATCAWCRMEFGSIADLLEHGGLGHLAEAAVTIPAAA